MLDAFIEALLNIAERAPAIVLGGVIYHRRSNGGMSSIHFRGVHQEVDHRGVVYQVASYDARPAW